MLQTNFPESLWAEAINTATYLRNRCATKSLDGITPFEAWTQHKPYVGFFRTIGSKAIALNKNRRGKKFQPKGEEYLLVGYSEESKAYRLWKPGTRTVIKARDVKFFERIEPSLESSSRKILTTPDKLEIAIEEHSEQLEDDIEDEDDPEPHDERDRLIEETEEDLSENPQVSEQEVNKPRRGVGRPKVIRTGKPGRPRKVHQPSDVQPVDLKSVLQIDQDNKEA